MKKTLLLFSLILLSLFSNSQAPPSIPYQAVVRNTDGSSMANAAVTITFKIHDNSATGTVVYEETHATTTSAQGLVSLNVGGGTAVTGTFSGIQWGSGSKFLHVLMNAGNGVVDLGTQQMMSVPYALYAEELNVRVSVTGDSLFIGDQVSIVPGVSAANPVPFYTEGQGAVDSQGNSYSTIVVGDQEWLEGYLKSDFFNNGERIDMHDLGQCYANGTSGGFLNYLGSYSLDTIIPMIADYWLDNGQRAAQDSLFGHYYSVGALVNTKNVCPVNWKVPSSTDIKVLMKRLKSDFDTASNVVSLNQEQVNVFWNELNWKISQEFYWDFAGNTNTFDYSNIAYNFDISAHTAPLVITSVINMPQPLATWILSDGKILNLETIMDHWQLRIIDLIDVYLSSNNHEYYFATKCISDSARVQYGCTNPNACNFHIWAQEDDGSCYAQGQNCDDNNGNTYNDVVLGDCTCAGILDTLPGVIGCEDVQVMIEGCNGVTSIEYFGEVYDLIELGGQCWFAEDLKTIQKRDSSMLLYYNENTQEYCFNPLQPLVFERNIGINSVVDSVVDSTLYNPFAYNLEAVIEDEVCPSGWHIPTECEWKYMMASIGATIQELNSNEIGCQNNLNGEFRMFNSFAGGFGDNTIKKEQFGFNGAQNTAGVLQPSYFYGNIFQRFTGGLEAYWWFGNSKYLFSNFGLRSLSVGQILRETASSSPQQEENWDEVYALRCVKGEKQVYGCMDVTACNYNFDANTEDGSCLHVGDVCNDSALQTLNDVINNVCECVGQLVLDTIINPGNGVQDIDGNHYSTVIIGNQEWMAENLKTTRFANGESINYFSSISECLWSELNDTDHLPAYKILNNLIQNNAKYGKMYNYYAANDLRGVCPSGWRVPIYADLEELVTFISPNDPLVEDQFGNIYSNAAGGMLKSLDGWPDPNEGASNSVGFSAIEAGSGWHILSPEFVGSVQPNTCYYDNVFYLENYSSRLNIGNSFTCYWEHAPNAVHYVRCIKNDE